MVITPYFSVEVGRCSYKNTEFCKAFAKKWAKHLAISPKTTTFAAELGNKSPARRP